MKPLLFLSFFLSFVYAYSTELYVSPGANGSGSFDDPFGSIEVALDNASGGDVIWLKKGVYREQVLLEGIQFSEMVTIKPVEGERVVIEGTEELSLAWEEYKPNVYKANVGKDIWQLFRDYEELVPARWPNAQFIDSSVFDRHLWAEPNSSVNAINGVVEDDDLQALAGKDLSDAMAILNIASFRTYGLPVLNFTGTRFEYTPITANHFRNKHHYYFLEGALALLDTVNEWYFDTLTKDVFVYAENIADLNSYQFRAKVQSYAFILNNCENIRLEGLNFFATTFYAENVTGLEVVNCYFNHPNCSKRMLNSSEKQSCTTVFNSNTSEDSRVVISHNIFEDTDGEALRLKGMNIIVEENLLRRIDWSCANISGLGVTVDASSCNLCKYIGNTVYTTGGSSTFVPGRSSTFMYNNVTNTGLLQSDGSVLQCTRSNVEGSEAAYNWIYNTAKYALRYDAPADDPTVAGKGGRIHHNVVFNTNGIMVKGDSQFVYNNTTYDNLKNGIIILPEEGSNTISKVYNNLCQQMAGHRSGSLTDNPLPTPYASNNWNGYSQSGEVEMFLNDPFNYDFMPISDQVIDQGVLIENINLEYKGAAPDIGAYEATGDYWKAGISWIPREFPWNDDVVTAHNTSSTPQLLVYPNPSNGEVFIYDNNEQVDVYNLQGQLIKSLFINDHEKILLTSGVYFLKKANHLNSEIVKVIVR